MDQNRLYRILSACQRIWIGERHGCQTLSTLKQDRTARGLPSFHIEPSNLMRRNRGTGADRRSRHSASGLQAEFRHST